MRRVRSLRVLGALTFTLAAGLALQACGGGGSSGGAVPITAPPPPPPPPAAGSSVPVAVDELEEIPAVGVNGGPDVRPFLSASAFAR